MTEVLAYSAQRRSSPSRQGRRGLPASLASLSCVAAAPAAEAPPQLLPAWECVGGRTSARQYAFDGQRLVLVDPQAFAESVAGGACQPSLAGLSLDALARSISRLRQRCMAAFLPDEGSVTCEYWAYARWRFAQRTASQALTVLATQQMLRAVGLGVCPAARCFAAHSRLTLHRRKPQPASRRRLQLGPQGRPGTDRQA